MRPRAARPRCFCRVPPRCLCDPVCDCVPRESGEVGVPHGVPAAQCAERGVDRRRQPRLCPTATARARGGRLTMINWRVILPRINPRRPDRRASRIRANSQRGAVPATSPRWKCQRRRRQAAAGAARSALPRLCELPDGRCRCAGAAEEAARSRPIALMKPYVEQRALKLPD